MSAGDFAPKPQSEPSWGQPYQHGGGGGSSGSGGGGWSTGRGDAFDDGVRAGRERAERHGLFGSGEDESAGEYIQEPLNATANVLEQEHAPARFVELLAELVTVASLTRVVYGEEQLNESEIEDFARGSSWFFNSWRHP